jgi:hypothetical protein
MPNDLLTGAGHIVSGNGAPYHRVRLSKKLGAFSLPANLSHADKDENNTKDYENRNGTPTEYRKPEKC